MPYSNFPNGFTGGVTIRGIPLVNLHTGDVRYVHSAGGNRGTRDSGYSTLEGAINNSSAGDTIIILPGHTETLSTATALSFDLAGLNIIGLGYGARRPTFTMGTIATVTIPVSAANISIQNVLFVANFADIASVFTLTTAPGFDCSTCEFRDTSSSLNFMTIVTTTVAVVADGLSFNANRISSLGTTAASTVMKIAGTHDRVQINDNYYTGAVLNNTAALLAHGALVVTNLDMARNKVFRLNTDTSGGGILITTSSTTNTGMVYDNYIKCVDAAASILVTAGCKYGMFNNMLSGAADTSGFLLPAADTDA